MKHGTLVRHRAKPEWGVGIALDDSNDGKCCIQFDEHGVVTLKLAVAGRDLEELGPDEVAAYVAARRPTRRRRDGGGSPAREIRERARRRRR